MIAEKKEKKSTDIRGCDIYYGGMTCEQMRATEMQITIGLRQCSVTNIVLKIVILKIMVMKIGEDDGDDSYAEKRR